MVDLHSQNSVVPSTLARGLFGAMLLAMLLLAGCAHPVSRLAEAAVDPAVPRAVSLTLEELVEAENQERINELLTIEGIEQASERFGRGLTRGMLSFLMMASMGDGRLSYEQLVAELGAYARELQRELTSTMVALVEAIVDAVLERILDPQTRRQVAAFSATVARAAAGATMEAIARGVSEQLGPELAIMIRRDIGPAMADVIRRDIGPAFSQMLDEDFILALGTAARHVSEQVVLGTGEGVRVLEEQVSDVESPGLLESLSGFLESADRATATLFWVLVGLIVLLLAITVGVGFWARRNLVRTREIEQRGELRERTVLRLLAAVRDCQGQPWTDELLDRISGEVRDTDEGEYLRSLLREHGDLRLPRQRPTGDGADRIDDLGGNGADPSHAGP